MEFYFYNTGSPPIQKKDDNPKMLHFLKYLDPIALKYETSKSGKLLQISRAMASDYEKNHQFGNLSKQEYSYMMENLRLVYGNDNQEVVHDIQAYHRVEKAIIYGYLGIPQLSRMFDEDYFNFEWDMHVGQNFREHRNNYYRDHFIHQIRNLYMMVNLLDKFGFDRACSEVFHQRKISRVSGYVYKCWRIFEEDQNGSVQQLLKKIWNNEFEKVQKIDTEQQKNEEGEESSEDTETIQKEKERTLKVYREEYFYKYITYASSILAALFHDMGYPICHFLEVRHRTSAYNPAMYMFTHNAVDSFDQIAAKLGQSLLFAIVHPEEIKKRLEPGKSGKYDHGAYSAIAFLLQFYETGLIHSLSQEKKCAIEMAALAIFNHTGKFRSINRKADTNRYSMPFSQNPVSFLLRFCDDLQEWDRRYFVISEASDFMFCPKCGYPLLKTKSEDSKKIISHYICGCNEPLIRPDIFSKRKLYLVTVADWVHFYLPDSQNLPGELQVTVHYDLYKLLMLTHIHNEYARYRLDDLDDLNKLVRNQNLYYMSGGTLGIKSISIMHFMTANPIRIKVKILEEYLKKVDWESSETEEAERENELTEQIVLEKIQDILNKEDVLKKITSKISKIEGTGISEKLQSVLEKENGLPFYLRLLFIQLYRKILGDHESTRSQLADFNTKCEESIKSSIQEHKEKHPQYYNAISLLVDDCLFPIHDMKDDHTKEWIFNKSQKMEKQDRKLNEDKLYYQVKVFTDSRNDFNSYQKDNMIGFFKDLAAFYHMDKKANSSDKEKSA